MLQGMGAVPDVANIDYLGFIAFMRPSVFLSLCPALPPDQHQENSYRERMLQEIRSGAPIGMPFLSVLLDEDPPHVHGHEGRHRMHAVMNIVGDDIALPIAFLLNRGDRARHVKTYHLNAFSSGMIAERVSDHDEIKMIQGPLFERGILMGQEFFLSANIPTP